jgi:hypothetical protein
MESVKTWLQDIIDETEIMDKQSYNNQIENLKKKGIDTHFIKRDLIRVMPENQEDLIAYSESITIALNKYYERWKNNEKDKEELKESFKPYPVQEPGGVSLTTKIAVVLYELKEKDPEQFNWFCGMFL